jgi:hypothetical protein
MLSNSNFTLWGPSSGTIHLTTPGNGAQTVDTQQTWPRITPWSYMLGEPPGKYVIDSVGDSPLIVQAALTIAAPNTLLVGGQVTVGGSGSMTAIGGVTFGPLPGASTWQGMSFDLPGSASSILSGVTFQNVQPAQSDACYEGSGPPTGALLLGTLGVCAAAPPWCNLSFPGLNADHAILPGDVTAAGVAALAANNPDPSATIYRCPIAGSCNQQ